MYVCYQGQNYLEKCYISHLHVYLVTIKALVVTPRECNTPITQCARLCFHLKTDIPLFYVYSGQRDTRQSSLREDFDSQRQRGDRKCILRTRGPCGHWVACFAVDLWVCGCASEGGVLWYDQLWRDVDSQSGSVAEGATLHRLLLSYAPLQSSNTDPTMSPQRVSATSTMR